MIYSRPFDRMLADLPDRPAIVEIGCAHGSEEQDAASQGWSTLAFLEHALLNDGVVCSIDINADHLQSLRAILSKQEISYWQCLVVLQGDGAEALRRLCEQRSDLAIDLLYIDGDIGGDAAAAQVAAALPALRRGFGRVVFDDCPSDDVPEHWENPQVRVSTVWNDPAAHGLALEWREGVSVSFRAQP